MHVAHHQAECYRGVQRLNILPSIRRCWSIKEHQENARDREKNKQKETQSTETKGVTDLYGVSLHLDRMQVIENRVHYDI